MPYVCIYNSGAVSPAHPLSCTFSTVLFVRLFGFFCRIKFDRRPAKRFLIRRVGSFFFLFYFRVESVSRTDENRSLKTRREAISENATSCPLKRDEIILQVAPPYPAHTRFRWKEFAEIAIRLFLGAKIANPNHVTDILYATCTFFFLQESRLLSFLCPPLGIGPTAPIYIYHSIQSYKTQSRISPVSPVVSY